MEVRYKIDKNFMKNIQKILGLKNADEVTSNALALLNWAAETVKEKRVILTIKQNGENAYQLEAPWTVNTPSDFTVVIEEIEELKNE